MSDPLPQYRYRDPLEVVIADEGKTCKGCTHKAIVMQRLEYCTKHADQRGQKMRRCTDYTEGMR